MEAALAAQSGATAERYFPEGYADRIARRSRASGLVDGVAPVIVETLAVRDLTSRQSEPRVTVFATTPKHLQGFDEIRADGKTVSLGELRPGEVYLNTKAADKLRLRPVTRCAYSAARAPSCASARSSTTRAERPMTRGVLMPLAAAQHLLGKPGLIRAVFVSNTHGVSGEPTR